MKIYVLPVPDRFRPEAAAFKYPKHNDDYGVEQDFHKYLLKEDALTVQSPDNADWHYLPVYWTRWHLNHDFAKSGVEELREEVSGAVIDAAKTFTVCQYDDGPVVKLGKTKVFLASRKGGDGIDIPLLSSPHKRPFFTPSKKYLASFSGRLSTHPLRGEMAGRLSGRGDVCIVVTRKLGSRHFVKLMLKSHVALCPRGYGGGSFRFFEAMQLGVVPFLLGDIDTRPFKKFIDWDEVSFYSASGAGVAEVLDSVSVETLLEMGKKAARLWEEDMVYQRWCKYVIKELGNSDG